MRALLVVLLLPGVALADDPDLADGAIVLDAPAAEAPAQATIPGVQPGPPPAPAEVDAIARHTGSRLRCPVCQGLSVADSNSAAATQMQGLVRELVAAGYTRVQIEDYFIAKYGEWVLLEPRAGGLNLLVWVAPVAGLAFAGAIAASLLRGRGEERGVRDPDTVVDETAGGALPPDDPHAARLLAEVDDD